MAKKKPVAKFGNMSYDPNTSKFKYTAPTQTQMQQQVNSEFNPAYAAQLSGLNSQYQADKQGLLGQQQGVMNEYKTGLNDVNQNAITGAQNANIASMNLGQGRSSFANNRLGEVNADKVKAISSLAAQKNAALGNIGQQRTSLATQFNSNRVNLNAERLRNMLARMNELKQNNEATWLDVQKWNAAVSK